MPRLGFTKRSGLIAIAALCALVLLAGCGGGGTYKNKLRPPAPINITASVDAHRVSVSPASFGAGPIVLIVSNQSADSQDVTLATDQVGKPGVAQSTGPINPQSTGQIRLDVPSGSYELKVADLNIKPATVTVERSRPSAQNQLLQP